MFRQADGRLVVTNVLSVAAAAVLTFGLATCSRTAVVAGAGPSVVTADCPPEQHDGSPGYGADGEFDTALEELVANQADSLGRRFAGASWESDGTVIFRITGGEVAKELRDHPKVRIVNVRFSDDRLEAAMDVVADRLNRLLAPDGQPMSNGAWPWWAHIDMERNVVGVMVDPSQRPKDRAIRRALADEMRAGTVQRCYGPVPVMDDAVGGG